MQSITVSKPQLLEALKKNRDEHRALFLKAQDVYRERAIEALDNRLSAARAGRKIDLYIALAQPEDHTDSFDTAISMVEWEQGDTVELSEQDFVRYVNNKWEWERSFAANTMSYVR